MDVFQLADLAAGCRDAGRRYLEFLRVPALSAGVYLLPAGADDAQKPHTEDELYYVAAGRGVIRVGAEDRPVRPGSVVYVRANEEHRFHSITEDLTLLVFFAPAEYSQSN